MKIIERLGGGWRERERDDDSLLLLLLWVDAEALLG
jgi:hypothetical protein